MGTTSTARTATVCDSGRAGFTTTRTIEKITPTLIPSHEQAMTQRQGRIREVLILGGRYPLRRVKLLDEHAESKILRCPIILLTS